MIDKIYHIFVSSTYSDLRDERKKVSEAIAKAGYVPEGMELFPASSQKQFEFIKRVIDRCDYYVLVIGGRYGSVADNNISYTEMEYDYATERGLPVLAFPHANPDKIEAGKTEKTPENIRRLQAFRERVSGGSLVDFWENPDELSAKVVVALGQEVTLTPGIGWVRGDRAIDPSIYQEVESLRKERDELRDRLGGDLFQFPDWLPNPSDPIKINLKVTITKTTSDDITTPRKTETLLRESKTVKASWNELIRIFGYEFYKPVHELYFLRTINELLCKKYISNISKYSAQTGNGFTEIVERKFESTLSYNNTRDFLVAADLIQQHVSKGSHGDYASYELTNKGKKYLAFLNK